jgi:hypothetical protein
MGRNTVRIAKRTYVEKDLSRQKRPVHIAAHDPPVHIAAHDLDGPNNDLPCLIWPFAEFVGGMLDDVVVSVFDPATSMKF